MEKYIEILFDDLTEEKQQEILDAFGDNQNWDIVPITMIPIESEDM